MQSTVEKTDHVLNDYQSILNRALTLLSRSERARKALIVINFSLGELVAKVQEDARYGENTVIRLAEDLSKIKGYQIYPAFLWECARVWRSFHGNIQRVWELEKELKARGIMLSWRFLVRKCTPLPSPERVAEAEAYWNSQLQQWEKQVTEIEEHIDNKEEIVQKMPEKMKEAFEGFVVKLTQDSAVKVNLPQGKKLEETLRKFDRALDILLEEATMVNDEVKGLLEKIKDKIEKLIGGKIDDKN